jgi:hypothetical protein
VSTTGLAGGTPQDVTRPPARTRTATNDKKLKNNALLDVLLSRECMVPV